MTPPDDVIRTAEAAKILGVSKATAIRYATLGLVRYRITPSGHRRYLRADVEDLRDNPDVKKWQRSIAQRPEDAA